MPAIANEAAHYIAGFEARLDEASYRNVQNRLANIGSGISLSGLDKTVSSAVDKLGKGFDVAALQVAGSLGRIPVAGNAAFESLAASASSAFSRIDVSSQIASRGIGSITDAAGTVAPALGGVTNAAESIGSGISSRATTAAASLRGIETGAAQATAGLSKVAGGASGAGSALSNLSAQFASNKAAIASYDAEIATARTELAQLSQRIADASSKFGPYSNQVKDLRAQYAQLSAATRGLTAEKGLLVVENRALSGSIAQTSTGLSTTTKAAGVAREGFNALTTQISTGQGILSGYDSIIQAVVRSFGGIPVIWAAAIGIGSVLLPKIIGLGQAKKEQIQVDNELIKTDSALVDLFERLSVASQGTNAAIKQQTVTFRSLLQIDLKATLFAIAGAYDVVTKQVANAQKQEAEYNRIIEQRTQLGQILSGQLQKENVDLAAVANQLEVAASSLSAQKAAIQEATTERGKAEAELAKSIETLVRFAQVTRTSSEDLIAQARAAGLSEEAITRLGIELKATTNAQDLFNAAVKDFQAPSISIEGTREVIGKITEDLSKAIGEMRKPGTALGDIFASIQPKVQALNDNLKDFAQIHGKNAADTLRIYRDQLSQLPPDLQSAIKLLDQAGKNAEAFKFSF